MEGKFILTAKQYEELQVALMSKDAKTALRLVFEGLLDNNSDYTLAERLILAHAECLILSDTK